MDTKVSKQLNCHKMHHSRSDIESLYVEKENDGRGLSQLELTYKTTTTGLKEYVDTSTDWMLQLVSTHRSKGKNIRLLKKVIKFANQLDLTPKEIGIKE